MVSQSKFGPFPFVFKVACVPNLISTTYFRMDGPIRHPMETQFTLPPREDPPPQQAKTVMSPFENHLRKWDRKLNHPTATGPGGTGQHSSALQAVNDENAAAEGIHASQPSAPSSSIPSLVFPVSPGS